MKKFTAFILITLIFSWTGRAFAQERILNTYYTSPFGSYDRLRLVPRASLGNLGTPCDAPGLMYTEKTSGDIRFCRDDDASGTGIWSHLSGVWNKVAISAAVGNDEFYIFPVATVHEDPSDISTILALGIGTTNPFPLTKSEHQRLHIHNSMMNFVNFNDPNAKIAAGHTDTLYERATALLSSSSDQFIRLVGTNDTAGMASVFFAEVAPGDGSFRNTWILQSFTEQTSSQFAINRYNSGDPGWSGYTSNYGVLVFSKDRNVGIGKFNNDPTATKYNPILSELHIQRSDGETTLRIDELLNDPNIVFDLSVIEGSPDRFSISGGYDGSEDIERLTLNTAGNLGIAKNNPQAKLHVTGAASLRIDGQDTGFILNDTNDDAFHVKIGSEDYLRFGTMVNSGEAFEPASWDRGLRFFYDATGADTKHRFLAAFGRISIGAGGRTQPKASLEIMNDSGLAIRPAPCSGNCKPRLTFNNITSADFQFEVNDSKLVLKTNYVADSTFPTLNSGPTFNTPLLTVTYGGEVAIGTSNPHTNNAFQVGPTGSACYVTKAGNWGDASSREYKTNIQPLEDHQAFEAFKNLSPVTFKYKNDPTAPRAVGFIAEDVPDLVATNSREGLNTLDITALLTNAVKQLQTRLEQQKELINSHKKEIKELEIKIKGLNLL